MSMPLRPMPVGFEDVAMCGLTFLRNRYNCNTDQIKRWRGELGIEDVKYPNTPRPVAQIRDGKVIRTYRSLGEAARAVDGNTSNIRNCAAGILARVYGYEWIYLD